MSTTRTGEDKPLDFSTWSIDARVEYANLINFICTVTKGLKEDEDVLRDKIKEVVDKWCLVTGYTSKWCNGKLTLFIPNA